MDASLQPFDLAAIESLRSINPDDGGEFLRELVDIFLTDTPRQIAEIEQGVACGDLGRLTRAAHSLKGSAGSFGAGRFSALARQIEAHGQGGDIAAVRAVLPSLQAEFSQLLPAFVRLKRIG